MTEMESLKESIMAGIDAKMSQNGESMWRRGLKEIKRLQSEQQEVLTVVGDLQDKQDALTAENAQLRAALCDVTAKFELVVNEMRQALRQLPAQRGELSPSPSVASTAASDAASPGLGGLLHATELAQGRLHVGHLERALQRYRQLPESFEEAWTKLVGINEKARLVSELNGFIGNRLDICGKVEDKSEACRKLLAQYEDALQKLLKATLSVLETQNPPTSRRAAQDESFTEPTPSSSNGNVSMTMGLTPAWPSLPEETVETFCTPPRASLSSEDHALLSEAYFQTWHGQYRPSPNNYSGMANASTSSGAMASSPVHGSSPPAVLSLASALTSAPAVFAASPTAAAASPTKQLQLAECLVEPAAAAAAASPTPAPGLAAVTPMKPTPMVKVELRKETGFTTLGMEVNEDRGTAIRVQSIDEHGLVGRYNRSQGTESTMLRVGDLIIEVNGVFGDPGGMLQECKNQQVLLLTIARGGGAAGSPAASYAPSPLGANAPNGSTFSGSGETCELDRVLAAVTSSQQFKDVAAPPASWGRLLRPDAEVFVPSSAQMSDSKSHADSLDLDAQVARIQAMQIGESPSDPETSLLSASAEGCNADGSEDGVARALFT